MAFRFPTGAVKSTEKPSLYLDFTKYNNVVDSRITCSGGANGTRVNSSGNVVSATCPRIDHNPVLRTNYLPYSTDMTTSGWPQDAGGWWTSRLSLDVPPPLAEARVTKFTSTTSSAPDNVFTRCNSLSLTAASRSASIYIYFPSNQGITEYRIRPDWGDVDIGSHVSSTVFDQWVRLDNTMTTTGTRTFLDFNIQVNGGLQVPSGVYFYCAAPQESLSLGDWIPTYATALSIYDCKGLLVEEARTNSIRNNTMVGAVAGTPGTLPTNWSLGFNTTTGLTRTVVGTGTENGINYIDIQIAGTAVGAGSFDIFFEAANTAAASVSQVWSFSTYWKIASGSLTGLTSPIAYGYEYSAASAFLGSVTFIQSILPTTSGLILQRVSGASTLAQATVAFVRPLIKFGIANGAAIDLTLRIGLPQLELGAFATSVLLTSGAAVTRSTDSLLVTGTNFSSWYNSTEGTFIVKSSASNAAQGTSSQPSVYGASDGTSNNFIEVSRIPTTATVRSRVTVSGVNQFNSITSSWPVNTVVKVCTVYKANDFAACLSAGTISTASSGTIPTVDRLQIGGLAGSSPWNGHIQSLTYYPKALFGKLIPLTT